MQQLQRHAEGAAIIEIDAPRLFSYLDDHRNLSAHMEQTSWMTLGSRVALHADAGGARQVGSRFGLSGSVLGLPLAVEEVVVVREAPLHKAWETVGQPTLWVIGPYRMGFDIAPRAHLARLRVFIDYVLPRSGLPRLLGGLFGRAYARWCLVRMLSDAQRHFVSVTALPEAAGQSTGLGRGPVPRGPKP